MLTPFLLSATLVLPPGLSLLGSLLRLSLQLFCLDAFEQGASSFPSSSSITLSSVVLAKSYVQIVSRVYSFLQGLEDNGLFPAICPMGALLFSQAEGEHWCLLHPLQGHRALTLVIGPRCVY